MLAHYILTSWRNIVRNKFYSLLLIGGFAVGLAASILLIMYAWDELTYDQFHEKKDRIFLVGIDGKEEGSDAYKSGWTTPPTGPAMQEYFPEVESFTRICLWFDEVLVTHEGKQYVEKGLVGADSSVFNLFSIPLLLGNPKTALTEPNTIVISETIARKYFGDKDPVGETLQFDQSFKECRITGVARDYPESSHIQFNILLSLRSFEKNNFDFVNSWEDHTFITYVLLHEKANAREVSNKLSGFLKTYFEPYLLKEYNMGFDEYIKKSGFYYNLFLEPLEDVHLSTLVFENREGKKLLTYVLGAVGFIIILLVCVNFINLATTLAVQRLKEMGIRKAVGGSRLSLAIQFLMESVFIVLAGMLLGMLLMHFSLPWFNDWTHKSLALNYGNPRVLAALFAVAITLGVLSGIYPALVLSSFKPALAMKEKASLGGRHRLKSGLAVFQFTLCIIMIIATGVVYHQLSFMSERETGFDKEHLIVIKRPALLNKNGQVFKSKILAHSNIQHVSFTNTIPGKHFDGQAQHLAGWPAEKELIIFPLVGDNDILDVLGIRVKEGGAFEVNDKGRKLAILNEAAVKKHNIQKPLEQKIDRGTMRGDIAIVGIAENFHFKSLHFQIEPLVIFRTDWESLANASYILVKTNGKDLSGTLEYIEDQWNGLSGNKLFEYSFLDQEYQKTMEREAIMAKVYTIFSLISIFISCLGLLGLSSFYAKKRQKEIGVRKVNGARIMQVMTLLNKDFLKWVLLAFIIACPIAWYAMDQWLQNFAFRTEIPWWLFGLAGIFALAIALLTVSWQSWRAASRNPVKSLRYE